MIKISPLDYHLAGFRALRIRDSKDDLVSDREVPAFTKGWCEDINGQRIGESTRTYYPVNRLYEFTLQQPKAGLDSLKEAIESARVATERDGLDDKGKCIYELILVEDESKKFWVRVGTEWTE